MNSRLLFIDGLRGVASSWVVIYHLVGRVSQDWLTTHGYLGVGIFFVLSGFVIAMAIGNARISLPFLGRFAARRAIRLDPPYWTSLVLLVALAVAAGTLFGIDRPVPTADAFVAHMFYLQDLLEYAVVSPVYWTLCFEVQFYLFLLLLIWVGQKIGGTMIIWFALLSLSLLENAGIIDISHNGFMLGYWYAFALGVTTYWVTAGQIPASRFYVAIALAAAAIPFEHSDWIVTAIATSCLIHLAARRGTMSDWLAGRVMQFLGRISYSLYLFHPLVGWTAMSVAMKFVNQWAALGVGIAASIASAYVAYVVLERPSISLSRKISLKRFKSGEANQPKAA